MKVVVASKNPVKIQAAQAAFSSVFSNEEIEVLALDADSGVPDQPMTYEQTREGAYNRVQYCIDACAEHTEDTKSDDKKASTTHKATFYIAFEGGVDVFEDGPKTFAVICISNGGEIIYGQTATLPLPMSSYQDLLDGMELGHSMDRLFDTHNIKQKGGAIGQLTAGLETRLSIYKSASILALSYFANAELFE